MFIGTVKEIKDHEFRVGLTPAGCHVLTEAGHKVLVERGAGEGSGFSDEEYAAAGAELLDKQAVFEKADMIIKVKEPLAPEYNLFHEGQILFTYLHLAPEPELTAALLKHKVVGIAFETVRDSKGGLPLLSPMSRVAGRMSVQIGAQYLEKQYGGKGMVLGGVPGVAPGQVVIIGGGTVGLNAARVAKGMGAKVAVLDMNPERLAYIDDIFGGTVETVVSNSYVTAQWVAKADLLISCVLVPGAMAPKVVKEAMVKTMADIEKDFQVKDYHLKLSQPRDIRMLTEAIAIHHTGSAEDEDITSPELHKMHLNNGWWGMGYHFNIRKNGTVELGTPLETIGAHAYQHNNNTIGIHLAGNFELASPTQKQLISLEQLIADLAKDYHITINDQTVAGHRHFNTDTTCPGYYLNRLLPTIRSRAIALEQQKIEAIPKEKKA